jgi:hypothetical protein
MAVPEQNRTKSRIFYLDLRCEDLYMDQTQKLMRTVVSRYRKYKNIYSFKIVHKDTRVRNKQKKHIFKIILRHTEIGNIIIIKISSQQAMRKRNCVCLIPYWMGSGGRPANQRSAGSESP